MAPKRKQAAPAAKDSKPPAKRRSKLAKEHNISPEDEAEINEAWEMFKRDETDSKHGVISLGDAKRCLVALNAPAKDNNEWKELAEILDPDEIGHVEYEYFYAVAAMKMNVRNDDPEAQTAEVKKAYGLFTRKQDREINIADLKRIAAELKEDVPESVLRDMIREATGGQLGTVSFEHFEDVMKRAGVFG